MKNFILGIDTKSAFDARDICDFIPLSENIEMDGIVIDPDYVENEILHHAGTPSLTGQSTAEGTLHDLAVELKQRGYILKIPNNHIFHPDKLVENSILYDLFISGNDLIQNNKKKRVKSLLDIKCPVLLLPKDNHEIKHLLILFDGTASSMAVIKTAFSIYGESLASASVSLLALHDEKVKHTYREHLIVNFLLSKFSDVGVLAIERENLNKEMLRVFKNNEGVMVFTGHYGAELILNSELKEYIVDFQSPIFFTH